MHVFGSFARGEAGPDSNLDLSADAGPSHSPWFLGGLLIDLRDLLGCDVDIVTEDAIYWNIRDWYIRDKIISKTAPL